MNGLKVQSIRSMKVKINSKFKSLWTDDYDIAIITGGRGSAKSFAASLFLENLTFEADHVILYTRYTMMSAWLSVIPELQGKIELMEHANHFDIQKNEVTNKVSGSKILYRGINTSSGNQTAKLKSIEGLSTFILDEAEELPDEKDFDTINPILS